MYPLLFSLVYLLHFYSTGVNYSYFTPRLLLGIALWITAYWLPIIVYCKWKRKDKLLFVLFVLHVLVFLGKPVTLALLPNLQQYTWFYPYRYICFSIIFILLSIRFWCWIRSKAGWNKKITQIFNIACLVLLALMGQRVMAIYPYTVDSHKNHVAINQKNALPNIYHICLDMHMGQQGLMDGFKYDNSKFYQQLGKIGLWYDLNSKSNYTLTYATFASMFQMDYLKQVDQRQWLSIIKNQATALDMLDQHGYYTAHYTRYNIFYSDSFCCTYSNPLKCYVLYDHIARNTFLAQCLKKTHNRMLLNAALDTINDICYAKTLHGSNGNYFFFHIANPHHPYVFDSSSWNRCHPNFTGGMGTTRPDLITQYKHIDSLILYAIQEILNQYDEEHKPIILLHGDHGLDTISIWSFTPKDFCEKHKINFSNLYAIYLPKQYRQALPPPPGLVNTFRWLFNTLFNTQYPYLESRQIAYNETKHTLYDITDLVNQQ